MTKFAHVQDEVNHWRVGVNEQILAANYLLNKFYLPNMWKSNLVDGTVARIFSLLQQFILTCSMQIF